MKSSALRVWLSVSLASIFVLGSVGMVYISRPTSPTPKTAVELSFDDKNIETTGLNNDPDEENEDNDDKKDNEKGDATNTTIITPTTNTNTQTNSVGGYLFAEVQKHDSKTSCWSVVNGGVYDLTSWISRHPGGSKVIEGMCGNDGTAAFVGQHGSTRKASAALVLLKIGDLKR